MVQVAPRGLEGPDNLSLRGFTVETTTKTTPSVVVTRDGVRVSPVLADENEAFTWLLRYQGQSVSYATTYGGYAIVQLPPSMLDMGLDDTDKAIYFERVEALRDKAGTPQVGHFVRFGDGTHRRISHDWGDEVQTSDGGSFHLSASGDLSFSGSLYPSIPTESLSSTGEYKTGGAWFFSHDHRIAHNGVDILIALPVWETPLVPVRDGWGYVEGGAE